VKTRRQITVIRATGSAQLIDSRARRPLLPLRLPFDRRVGFRAA